MDDLKSQLQMWNNETYHIIIINVENDQVMFIEINVLLFFSTQY